MAAAGTNIYIGKNTHFSAISKIQLASHIWIGPNCHLDGSGTLTIGNGVIIGRNTEILTNNHNYDSDDLKSIPYDERFVHKPVSVGDCVWIGTRVIILPGVNIGEGAIIGAGAVVNKNVPSCAVVAGNPAQIIKYRNAERYHKLKQEGLLYIEKNYNFDESLERLIIK